MSKITTCRNYNACMDSYGENNIFTIELVLII